MLPTSSSRSMGNLSASTARSTSKVIFSMSCRTYCMQLTRDDVRLFVHVRTCQRNTRPTSHLGHMCPGGRQKIRVSDNLCEAEHDDPLTFHMIIYSFVTVHRPHRDIPLPLPLPLLLGNHLCIQGHAQDGVRCSGKRGSSLATHSTMCASAGADHPE